MKRNKTEDKRHIGVIGLKGLPAFGGAATVGENIIEQLKGTYTFTVYGVATHANRNGEFTTCRQVVFRKFPVKALNIFMYYLKSAFHALLMEDYNIIHLHHLDGAFILPLLRLKYKVICTVHARPQVAEKWSWPVKVFFRMNEKIMLQMASDLTGVSEILVRDFRKYSNRSVHYIPNGINVELKIGEQPVPVSKYLLFAAGRIIPVKGLHLLLQALQSMQYSGPVLIIGDLNQVAAYRKQIMSLATGLNVEFVDIIRDKPLLLNYVRQASLFVFPSLSENMSMMLLEAAFTRTPIVCSDIPENRAIFSDNEMLFFRSGEIHDLVEKIGWAMDHPIQMKQFSSQAYNRLLRDFDWRIIANQYKERFTMLME